MTLATEVKKITESKPFYAITGVGDYAVEKLREIPDQLEKLQSRRGEIRATAKDLPAKAREYAAVVQVKAEAVAKDLPERAREYADTAAARLTEVYDELAIRGRKVVSKVSGEAAHELEVVSEAAQPAIAKPAPKPATTTTTAKKTTRPKTTTKS